MLYNDLNGPREHLMHVKTIELAKIGHNKKNIDKSPYFNSLTGFIQFVVPQIQRKMQYFNCVRLLIGSNGGQTVVPNKCYSSIQVFLQENFFRKI